MKIGLAQINTTVGDMRGNLHKVSDAYARLCTAGAELVVYPELVLCGYPPRDLLLKGRFVEAILEALEGCEALLIGSSAKVATLEFDTGVIDPATGRPKLGFPKGQPYEVDWLGQRNQIDAAQKCGCTHVVICSSMGGTNPDHMLNGLGRDDGDPAVHREGDPETKGNILQWKRKAEKYLIESGLTYTIIHPGGLVDKPGGCRELVVGVDDVMVDGEGTNTIPRDDVAETMVQSLRHEAFRNRSFDLRSKLEGDGEATSDVSRLLAPLGGRNCDYALGKIPDD